MASIRRTLSPSNHRIINSSHHHNSRHFFAGIRRFIAGTPPEKPHLRRGKSWKKPFLRCLVCFFIGFLLGILPFGHVEDVRTHDFSFEIKREPIEIKENEIAAKLTIAKPSDVVLTEKFDVDVDFDVETRKLLIVVTPTYNRALQGYYLTRLGQVLRLVKAPVLWIVVEMNAQSSETASILRSTGVMYRHLVCKKNMTDVKDRGVQQRNTALEHVQVHRLDGVVYFADDDNVYSLELFESVREISRFGTWPVAMLAPNKNKAIVEGPVCNGSQVIGWHTNEKSKRLRRFHVDMSGFAFNSTILWDPKRWQQPFLKPIRQLDTVKEGFQETTFIEQLVAEESQMEGVPEGCAKIMNWHLHLDARGFVYPKGWILQRNLDVVQPID